MTTLKSKKKVKVFTYEQGVNSEANSFQEHATSLSKSPTENKDSNQHLDDDWVLFNEETHPRKFHYH